MNKPLFLIKRNRVKSVLFGLFILYNLIGFLLVPWLISAVIPDYISEKYLNGALTIERAKVNPYTFEMAVEGVSLVDSERESVAYTQIATFNLGVLRSLFSWRFFFSDIQVSEARLDASILEDGSISLSSLLKPFDVDEAIDNLSGLTLPPIDVGNFYLNNSQVGLTDHWLGGGYREEIRSIEVNAQAFSTAADSVNAVTLIAGFAAGAQATWEGTIQFNPLSSSGTLKLEGFRPDAYEPYYRQLFDAELSTEALSMSFDYIFAPADDTPQIKVENMRLEQANVILNEPGAGRILFEAPRIAMDAIAVDFITGQASMGQLTLEGERLLAARAQNKEINLIKHLLPKGLQDSLFDQETAASVATPWKAPLFDPVDDAPRDILYAIQKAAIQLQSIIELAWQVEMDHVEIRQREIELIDQSVGIPAQLLIESFDLRVTELSNREGEDAQLGLSMDIRGGGRIEITGTVTPVPTTMRLSYAIMDIDLSVVSPYLAALNESEIDSGLLNTTGELFVDFGPFIEAGDLPELEISGGLTIRDFSLVQSIAEEKQEILAWERMSVVDYTAATKPAHRLELGAIDLDQPYAFVEVLEDATLSWQQLVPEAVMNERKDLEPEGNSVADPFYLREITLPVSIDVAEITVDEGVFEVIDHFYGAGFHAKWEGLNARIDNLNTNRASSIEIEAHGRQVNGSIFEAKVTLDNPLSVERSIIANFQSQVLASPFTPYAERVVGFPIEEGHIQVDTRFELSKDVIDARVKVDMDQFSLGDKADVEDVMINLPVKLGISLMKDREGKIDLPEVKVDGSLTDPEFNVGEIIGGVFVRIITNAVTKPFSFLSSAFGSENSEDLDRLLFEPGSAELSLSESDKLETLADALFNRPQLTLQIEGCVDIDSEILVVRERTLRRDLDGFTGLAEEDGLKILYYERLPEAFTAYQATHAGANGTTASAEETASVTNQEAGVTADSAPAEASQNRARGIFGFFGRIFGSGSAQDPERSEPLKVEGNSEDASQSKSNDEESFPSVAEDPMNPWISHIALTDESLMFPETVFMKTALLEQIEIPDTYWTELAQTRGVNVQEALRSMKEISEERLILSNANLDLSEEKFIGVRFEIE